VAQQAQDSVCRFEYWEIGAREAFVYTEDRLLAERLRDDFGPATIYHSGPSAFGWQFRVPQRIVGLMKKRFAIGDEHL
jgi:hypothetical protein